MPDAPNSAFGLVVAVSATAFGDAQILQAIAGTDQRLGVATEHRTEVLPWRLSGWRPLPPRSAWLSRWPVSPPAVSQWGLGSIPIKLLHVLSGIQNKHAFGATASFWPDSVIPGSSWNRRVGGSAKTPSVQAQAARSGRTRRGLPLDACCFMNGKWLQLRRYLRKQL